ncbi:MAG TPA: DUF4238 domain-containing protein [Sphingomicrobium sp.]|nr:DUF4238 domain-containing protein [Sphingomicrobium sp.]
MSIIGGSARNHHFVPQFYLKGFAKPRSKDGKLLVCDLKERRRFQTKPRNVAARRDFNRVNAQDLDPNIVETQLGLIEADLERGFRQIIKAQSLASQEDFAAVLALIARLFLANPQFRDQRDRLMSDVAKKVMLNMVATPERWASVTAQGNADGIIEDPVDYEEMRAAVVEERIVPHTNKDVLIAQEFDLWPQILPLLEQRNWTLFVSNAATGEFTTSDRPCTLRWSEPGTDFGIYGPGLGVAGTSVIFPISRHLAIDGRFEQGGGIVQATPELVAAVNLATLSSAMRQLYSAEDFPIMDLDRTIRLFSQSELWLERICKRPPDDARDDG